MIFEKELIMLSSLRPNLCLDCYTSSIDKNPLEIVSSIALIFLMPFGAVCTHSSSSYDVRSGILFGDDWQAEGLGMYHLVSLLYGDEECKRLDLVIHKQLPLRSYQYTRYQLSAFQRVRVICISRGRKTIRPYELFCLLLVDAFITNRILSARKSIRH